MGGAFGASIDGAATQDVEAHGAVALRALTDGKMPVKCVPGRLAMARLRPDAFPGGNPWQFFHSMYPKRGLGRENRPFLARYSRRASEMSWLWQDMRAMHPKSPANRLSGMHSAQFLPGRGPFRCTDPSNHAWGANLAIPRAAEPLQLPQLCRLRTARALAASCAAEQRERLQPRRRPYGRRNGARAASCRAG